MAFVQSLSVVTEAATFSNSSVQDCSYHFQTKIIYVLPNYDRLNCINAAMLSLVMLTFPWLCLKNESRSAKNRNNYSNEILKLVSREMTSEAERAEKFHTDNVSLPKSG